MKERNLCEGCYLCCRHVAVEINKPENKKEFKKAKEPNIMQELNSEILHWAYLNTIIYFGVHG